MKATSFLDMVTLLTATAKSDKEIDAKLSKLILLYNKPVKELCMVFSNLHQLKIGKNDYFDKDNNTLHFDSDIFALNYRDKQFIHKVPRNINELITTINSCNIPFKLEFKESIIKEFGFNDTFKDLMRIYGLQ